MKLSIIVIACLLMVACIHKSGSTTPAAPLEQQARNVSAALQGAIVAAQTEWTQSCQTNSKQSACDVITRSIAGQNALITSIEAYCAWDPRNPPADPAAKCVADTTAQSALESALSNAQTFIGQLKGVLGK